MRIPKFLVLIAALSMMGGCVTIAGNRLPDLERSPASSRPSVQQTVGDFGFHLDGGKMITSNKAGRILNDEIFKRWKTWGYISGHRYVKSGQFTGSADYEATLSGFQDGQSSIFLQIISGVSLCVIPYYVDTVFTVKLDVRNTRTGQAWHAEAEDSYNTVVSLLLLPFTPFGQGGGAKTYDRIAANLYEQLRSQGAFADSGPATDGAATTP